MKKLLLTLSVITFLLGCQKTDNVTKSNFRNKLSSIQNPLLGDCTPNFNIDQIPALKCTGKFKVCIKQLKSETCNSLQLSQHMAFAYNYMYKLPNGQIVTEQINLGTLYGSPGSSIIETCIEVTLPIGLCGYVSFLGGCTLDKPCPYELTFTPLGCPGNTAINYSKKIVLNDGDLYFTSFSHCLACSQVGPRRK